MQLFLNRYRQRRVRVELFSIRSSEASTRSLFGFDDAFGIALG